MTSKGDFHTHSTISDGRLTPAQLVDLAMPQAADDPHDVAGHPQRLPPGIPGQRG